MNPAPATPLPPVRIDFLYGAVASRDFPTLTWRRAWRRELLHQPTPRYYAAPEGEAALRRALQAYLRRARGLDCHPGQIVIVNGSQQAIDLCARLLLDPGDAFAFEDPGYVIARNSLAATGAALIPVPVDEQGLQITHLPRRARTRLVYVTPSHQFPLGGVLPVGRRQALLEWARQLDAWVIEDDYDGEFRYGQRPIDALQSVDRDGRVIYIGTFSKTLTPQLRLGYLVLPDPLVAPFVNARRLIDRHTGVLDQRVIANLIDSGVYERHVRRVRRANERRRTALLDAIATHLPQAEVAGTAAGLHVVLWLPSLDASREPALVATARAAGIGVYPVSPLYDDAARRSDASGAPDGTVRRRPAGLTLGYASLTVEQIAEGIATLATIPGLRPMRRGRTMRQAR